MEKERPAGMEVDDDVEEEENKLDQILSAIGRLDQRVQNFMDCDDRCGSLRRPYPGYPDKADYYVTGLFQGQRVKQDPTDPAIPTSFKRLKVAVETDGNEGLMWPTSKSDYFDSKERAAVSTMKHAFQALKLALQTNNRLVQKHPMVEEDLVASNVAILEAMRLLRDYRVKSKMVYALDEYLLVEIFKHLQWSDLYSLSLVCRLWCSIAHDRQLRAHLECSRKLTSAGRAFTMSSYTRQLIVWKDHLVAGCGGSLIKLFNKRGVCVDSAMGKESEGMIESLVTWQPPQEEDTYLVSGSDYGTVRVWSLDAAKEKMVCLKRWDGGERTVRLKVWYDGLIVGCGDKLSMWDFYGDPVVKFDTKALGSFGITCLAIWRDMLCVSSTKGVSLFTRTGQLVKENLVVCNPATPGVKQPLPNTRSLFVLGNNWLCCGVDEPYSLQVFDEKEENIKHIKGFGGAIFGMAGLGKTRLLTVDGKNWLKLWDLSYSKNKSQSGTPGYYEEVECVQEFQDHEDQVYCITWWDGKLFTGDYTGTVRVWI